MTTRAPVVPKKYYFYFYSYYYYYLYKIHTVHKMPTVHATAIRKVRSILQYGSFVIKVQKGETDPPSPPSVRFSM